MFLVAFWMLQTSRTISINAGHFLQINRTLCHFPFIVCEHLFTVSEVTEERLETVYPLRYRIEFNHLGTMHVIKKGCSYMTCRNLLLTKWGTRTLPLN